MHALMSFCNVAGGWKGVSGPGDEQTTQLSHALEVRESQLELCTQSFLCARNVNQYLHVRTYAVGTIACTTLHICSVCYPLCIG